MVGFYVNLLNLFKNLCVDTSNAIGFLSTPIDGINLSPLSLLSISGITALITIAVVKWLVS